MSNFKNFSSFDESTRFSGALFGKAERSRMTAFPRHITTFNAGDIVPVYCKEVLPSESMSFDVDFVIRQTTLLTPTMGSMHVDLYAFFVPNRIVNQSWKALVGENLSGSWTAPQVSLAPLVNSSTGQTQIPVGSVADYYGFPTQQPLPNSLLSMCHDLKFRGYVMIYNEFFRDQNYQPPLPLSTLNIYQGFFTRSEVSIPGVEGQSGDGSVGAGSVVNSLVGAGSIDDASWENSVVVDFGRNGDPGSTLGVFSALNRPLKANKLHDRFTSVLPSPEKSPSSVFAPVSGAINSVPVVTSSTNISSNGEALRLFNISTDAPNQGSVLFGNGTDGSVLSTNSSYTASSGAMYPANLVTQPGFEVQGLAMDVADIRMAAAIQQYYEVLARGGSRYRELVQSFFGIEADNPYSDVPTCLGKISRDLDLYQTAQTSASESGSTAQGNLAAFGYTPGSGHLFDSVFLEHGYVHVFAVVRHKNIYPSLLGRDNFRLNALDYYWPQLANISEQPVFTYEINPFASDPTGAFGYQEAWSEYRYEPDFVSGYMRPGVTDSLSLWNYADDFSSSLQISDGLWLRSNSEDVLNRTLAVSSSVAPQFKAEFKFNVDKELPMPTYSVPGMDII